MLELLLIMPNLLASFLLMQNKAFQSNLVYSFGYLLMIWHNWQINDKTQLTYFAILELMAVIGVLLYLKNKNKSST